MVPNILRPPSENMRQPQTRDTWTTRLQQLHKVLELQHSSKEVPTQFCLQIDALMVADRRQGQVLTKDQQQEVARTLERLKDEGHIPRGWYTVNLHHCFAHPSYLKAHDWLLLAGAIGKYILPVSHIRSFVSALCLQPFTSELVCSWYVINHCCEC